MKGANMTRGRPQVYSIGNYLMTGKILGKGHFARVEEATHRIVGKKVAIKIIDLTLIKEEYARRNLHREPRVMARLRHPCIAALYETMMHGPRLYVVMEAAGGGDLCAHVLAARGGGGGGGGAGRGLPEPRARALAAQLVSAVRHMHHRGVVHRDLKMENIMLDITKQFIKIVDFGLSNVWVSGGALRTPCGSLEYAAPELFVDGRRYGPEVDLWSVGVIVYGMVTGGLPFTAAEGGAGGAGAAAGAGGETRDRPLLRQVIARGFGRKQRAALACVSADCKVFIQHLLEPNVELRMKIEEAARNRWVRRPGMRMKAHPFGNLECRMNRDIYKQISELSGQSVVDVSAQIKADPFGEIAGMYNIKTHHYQLQALPVTELLWSNQPQGNRPSSPPEYRTTFDQLNSKLPSPPLVTQVEKLCNSVQKPQPLNLTTNETKKNNFIVKNQSRTDWRSKTNFVAKHSSDSRFSADRSVNLNMVGNRPTRAINDSGDGYLNSRLPSIDEHSNTCLSGLAKHRAVGSSKLPKAVVRKVSLEDNPCYRLNSCPTKTPDNKMSDFYRKAGDGLPSWRAGAMTSPARLLLQSNSTSIKRASLGNIASPHSSTNSHCKSERAMPVGWCSRVTKEIPHLQRYRRNAPAK